MTNTKGMETRKQTATMWLTMKLGDLEMLRYNGGMDVIEYLKAKTKVLQQAKEMEKQQSQQYAEFCVMCDREKLPLLDFESYILTYGTNK
jgi:hypothetical protein